MGAVPHLRFELLSNGVDVMQSLLDISAHTPDRLDARPSLAGVSVHDHGQAIISLSLFEGNLPMLAHIALLATLIASPTDRSLDAAKATEGSPLIEATMTGAFHCDEVCMGMTDGSGNHITMFCAPVDVPFGDGSGCTSSVGDCTFLSTEGCGEVSDEEFDELAFLVSSSDGRLLTMLDLCKADGSVVRARHIDFLLERQRGATLESALQ